jgi:hypothetical protein
MYNLVLERLPGPRRPILKLARRRGTLVFQPKGKLGDGLRLELVYLGLDGGQPRFRLDVQEGGQLHRLETTASGRWDAAALLERRLGRGRRDFSLTLEPGASGERPASGDHLPVTGIRGEWDTAGLVLPGLLSCPMNTAACSNPILRRGEMSPEELAAHLGRKSSLLPILAGSAGVLHRVQTGGKILTGRAWPRNGRQPPHRSCKRWAPGRRDRLIAFSRRDASGGSSTLLGDRGRFFLGIALIALTFLLVEGLILAQAESFTDRSTSRRCWSSPCSAVFSRCSCLSPAAGRASRVPGSIYCLLSHPPLLSGIYLLNLVGIFLHGLVIWQNPVQRLVALSVGVLMLVMTVSIVRRGRSSPGCGRAAGERSQPGQAQLTVVASGQPTKVEVSLNTEMMSAALQAASGSFQPSKSWPGQVSTCRRALPAS